MVALGVWRFGNNSQPRIQLVSLPHPREARIIWFGEYVVFVGGTKGSKISPTRAEGGL